MIEHGKPLVYGQNGDKGIKLDGFKPVIVDIAADQNSINDLWVHDERDRVKAGILSRFFERPVDSQVHFPRPFGVFYTEDRTCYETGLNAQVDQAKAKKAPDLDALLRGRETWVIG